MAVQTEARTRSTMFEYTDDERGFLAGRYRMMLNILENEFDTTRKFAEVLASILPPEVLFYERIIRDLLRRIGLKFKLSSSLENDHRLLVLIDDDFVNDGYLND